jgi:capsular exopolysaccharide synthesis family protein
MSANLPPLPPGSDPSSLPVPADDYAVQPYAPAYAPAPGPADESGGGINLARFGAALGRYKWLVAALAIVGVSGGFAVTRFIDPQYEVYATVFTENTGPNGGNRTLLSPGPLAQNAGWRDLLRSYAIIDPVVQELSLYLRPKKASDSLLFANFTLDPVKRRFTPGEYTLKTEKGRYSLTDKIGFVREQGTVGDSVGRMAGFAWAPPARLLGTRTRTVEFTVMTPREASRDILGRFTVSIQQNSPVIGLSLRGTATDKPAATLNAMLTRFVDVASELKKRELVASSTVLATQLDAAQARLQDAERQLESYRVGAITKPSESPVMMSTNTQANNMVSVGQPVFNSYFMRKTEVDLLRRDREALERLAVQVRAAGVATPIEALLSIPSVARDEAAATVRQTVNEIVAAQTDLRQKLQVMTDSNPVIKDTRRNIADLRERILPQRVDAYLATMRTREAELREQLAAATNELEGIPQRTIQEGALVRERDVLATMYTQLRSASAQANLAQQSAVPDVKILDSAVTPLTPSTNTAPMIIGGGLVAGLLLGVGLAFLLDRLDNRFRYPEQAKSELGLEVLGVVPVVDQSGRQSPEAVAQIVEAFRSIRMNVRYAAGGQRSVVFGITSPGPGDGKSLVASNLALSFAEGGWRTVLIDADTRRGQLHATFDTPAAPGVVEYLEGTSLLGEVVSPTRHDNLSVIPCGTRHRRAPELLATPRMQQLLASLAAEFEVVIIDTPPLGAGTDAYAVGTACGQLAVILRSNRTNLKMAKAKLSVLSQLPVTVLGAVLNEVRTDSAMYQYYSYDPEYVLPEESPALAAGGGTAVAVRD